MKMLALLHSRKTILHVEKEPLHCSADELFILKVKKMVYANIGNELFDVNMLANHLCMSVSQLNRKLKELLDCSSGQLIRNIRLEYAAHLLVQNHISIGEISFMVGYANQANFSRSFKRKYGCSPFRYSKQKNVR